MILRWSGGNDNVLLASVSARMLDQRSSEAWFDISSGVSPK